MSLEPKVHADFYRSEYAEVAQAHRRLWESGPSMLRAYNRPAAYLEPAMAEVTLQICTRGKGGEARLDLNAGRFHAPQRRGLFVVAPASAPCHYSLIDKLDLLILPFDPAAIAEVSSGSASFERLHSQGWQDETVLRLAETLWIGAKGGSNKLFADSARLAILSRLVQLAAQRREPPKAMLSRPQVRRITDLFEADLRNEWALSELAAQVSLSPFHFARAFKATTGLPPHNYLVQLRMERARELLDTTDLPVTEISARVGYDDPGYLAQRFRKHFGTTPTAHRKARKA